MPERTRESITTKFADICIRVPAAGAQSYTLDNNFVSVTPDSVRPLQNAPFCTQSLRQSQILARSEASALTFSAILEILNVFLQLHAVVRGEASVLTIGDHIFALTRGIHVPRPSGKIDFVQFRYPAELPLRLNKIESFSKVSLIGGVDGKAITC